jgi:hypothetical protein
VRRIPVDMSQLSLIATGKIAAVPQYANLADGSSRMVPGSQAVNDQGVLMWTVDCLVDDGSDDEDGRAEVIGVKVASAARPQVSKFQPVPFVGVIASIYRDKATGQPRTSLQARGMASGKAAS